MLDQDERRASGNLSHKEHERAASDSHMRALLVYEIIRRRGVEELERPSASLFWSGVAGGLAVSTSVYGKAFLHGALPDEVWRPVISNLGYTVGFVIVVMGRLQLFTENTITAVLPVLSSPTKAQLWRTGRLWAIVFLANMIGCMMAATLGVVADTSGPGEMSAAMQVSQHFAENGAFENLLLGIPAGFFIAAVVWTLPNARGSEFGVIVLLTYMIGIGGQTHVIAGATELFLLFFSGSIGLWHVIGIGIVPTFLGNVIGGTVLFALIAYGQIKEEI